MNVRENQSNQTRGFSFSFLVFPEVKGRKPVKEAEK